MRSFNFPEEIKEEYLYGSCEFFAFCLKLYLKDAIYCHSIAETEEETFDGHIFLKVGNYYVDVLGMYTLE
jgi:hypothetical protein